MVGKKSIAKYMKNYYNINVFFPSSFSIVPQQVRFILDTGATRSFISFKSLKTIMTLSEINNSVEGTHPVNATMANGSEIQPDIVKLQDIRLGQFTISEWSFLAYLSEVNYKEMQNFLAKENENREKEGKVKIPNNFNNSNSGKGDFVNLLGMDLISLMNLETAPDKNMLYQFNGIFVKEKFLTEDYIRTVDVSINNSVDKMHSDSNSEVNILSNAKLTFIKNFKGRLKNYNLTDKGRLDYINHLTNYAYTHSIGEILEESERLMSQLVINSI